MNRIVKLVTAVVLVAAIGTLSACKKTFDAPPGPGEVNIVANTTIADLKAYHVTPGAYDLIGNDVIISGIVVANDKSGNFYKQLFIQDETGAMQLLVNAYSMYATYPVGRKVYVKCKGLTLSDQSGNMVLGVKILVDGLPSIDGIPGSVVSQYLVGSTLDNPVEPITVTVADLGGFLNDRYINALVKLEDYEFIPADTSKIYSDTSANKSTTNRFISLGCTSGTQTIVRTSGYANFAATPIAKGNGDITAIYTVYKPGTTLTKQLIIRDTADVQFNNPRCGAPPVGTITLLNEGFESQVANTVFPYNNISIPDWFQGNETSTFTWVSKIFSGNKYAYMSAFSSTNLSLQKTWLVTKGIDMNGTTNETLVFDTKQDFLLNTSGVPVPSQLKVMISTNYDGVGNPWDASVTWTDVTSSAVLSPGSTTGNFPANYTTTTPIDLSSYTGTVHIAFEYIGQSPSANSAWEVDNIKVFGL